MPDRTHTRCCIVGGGPAGMMLGLLLARAGVRTTVLEKHQDFLRDFRGDTVHPSTLQIMHELGLLERLLARPHDNACRLQVTVSGNTFNVADFSRLHTRCGFIAMMPQWEFLDFLRAEVQRYAHFSLRMQAEAIGLLRQHNGVVSGVRVQTPAGTKEIGASLVIGADGRHSRIRSAAGLKVQDFGAPIDVLWLRLPTAAGDPRESGGRIERGQFLAMIHRGSYWQCAYVIPKGGIEQVRRDGLASFQDRVARIAPLFAERVQTLVSWDDIKLLSVSVDRLQQWWRPGLLCIGDAAHAMSPIGGVGINLAIQDAVAAANILAAPLADPSMATADLTPLLARIQRRRLWPTRITQRVQVAIQKRLLAPPVTGRADRPLAIPWPLRLLSRYPALQALPAYAIGIGARPERVNAFYVIGRKSLPLRPGA